ncbi:helix-hairpin-helix domain-containing protein [Herminiimonas sp. CN]|uniref:ComEA family DNA-binding protein n=1 Tax=Herminiimonas sp. CN TaxID=1349818 RepID=UPI0004740130|nr:helix-hairpin-helix domain-containing protein [Herminiimonas sp. CN]
MFKKLLLGVISLIATMSFAFAQVDVNKADQAGLDSVKGIGPAVSKKILDERKKGGDFKDWMDLEKRVKGIGEKNSSKLSAAGLTVNGQSKPNAPAKAPAAAKADKKVKAGAEPKAAATADKSMPAAAPASKDKKTKPEAAPAK